MSSSCCGHMISCIRHHGFLWNCWGLRKSCSVISLLRLLSTCTESCAYCLPRVCLVSTIGYLKYSEQWLKISCPCFHWSHIFPNLSNAELLSDTDVLRKHVVFCLLLRNDQPKNRLYGTTNIVFLCKLTFSEFVYKSTNSLNEMQESAETKQAKGNLIVF